MSLLKKIHFTSFLKLVFCCILPISYTKTGPLDSMFPIRFICDIRSDDGFGLAGRRSMMHCGSTMNSFPCLSSSLYCLRPWKKKKKMSQNVRKRTLEHLQPVKIQFSLLIRTVWSEYSLDAFWITKDAKFLNADNEDWTDCADAQTDMSLCWVYTSEETFSNVSRRLLAASQKHAYIMLTPLNPTFI